MDHGRSTLPTASSEPSIAVETNIEGVTYPASGTCGRFDIIMNLEICNDGPVEVHNLNVDLDLAGFSKGIFAGNARIVGIVEEDSDVDLSGDLNIHFFNGSDTTDLFKTMTASLDVDECVVIQVQWEVAPDEAASPAEASEAQFITTAIAEGECATNLNCFSQQVENSIVLGDCWQRSRNIAANNLLNVSLIDCQAIVTPAMILRNYAIDCDLGDEYPLGGFYRIRMLYPGEVEPAAPELYVEIKQSDFPDGRAILYLENISKSCEPIWTEARLENKSPSVFECETMEEVNDGCRELEGQTYKGTTSGRFLDFGNLSCFVEVDTSPVSCLRSYRLIEKVKPSKTSFYTFILETSRSGMLSIHQNGFDPDQACSNIIAQSSQVYIGGDPVNANGSVRLTLPLNPEATYDIVITTDGDDCASNVPFSLYAIADDPEAVLENFSNTANETVELCAPLFCGDLEKVFNNEASLAYIPAPQVELECGSLEALWFEDVKETGRGDCRGDQYIYRHWYARDDLGNEAEICTQNITFRLPALNDVIAPPITVPLECDEDFVLDENGRPHPDASGYPYLITLNGVVDLKESYCNLGADYRDISVVEVCEQARKITRQWILVDWCNLGESEYLNNDSEVNYRQILKTGDFSAPEIVNPTAGISLFTTPFGCEAILNIPEPEYIDACSDEVAFDAVLFQRINVPVVDQYGRPTGQTIVEKVEIGPIEFGRPAGVIEFGFVYEVVYTLTDQCGNTSKPVTQVVQVQDNVKPVAICADQIYFSLSSGGKTKINPEDIDEGSWDNCEIASLKISRSQFTCSQTGPQLVVLSVRDKFGNTNTCNAIVFVEDKIAPVCIAPPDITLLCDELPYGFDPEDDDDLSDLFGEALVSDNCTSSFVRQIGLSVDWNCNAGTIVRTFEADDNKGSVSVNHCRQTIKIDPVHNYEIKFPKDAEANCAEPNPDSILTKEIACDLLSVSMADERFEASGDACYKIKRVYKVINWCEYNGEDPAVVISRDADCDGLTGEKDVYLLVRTDTLNNNKTIVYLDGDEEEKSAPETSPCANGAEGHYDNSEINHELTSVGFWEYTQYIKVYDAQTPVITIGGADYFFSLNNVNCDAEVSIPISVFDECAGSDVLIQAFINGEPTSIAGEYPNFTVAGRYELGQYQLEIQAEDGCRNSEVLSKEFQIVDAKAPAPICIEGLAVELMPVEEGTDADGDGDRDLGAMTIWASDFKVSGLEDCSGSVELSINRLGEQPNRNQKSIVLTCNDPDTLALEIYAWDGADNLLSKQPDGTFGGPNFSSCLTYVLVQDNMFGLCAPFGPASVAGLISTDSGLPVENVSLKLTGDKSEEKTSDQTGHYTFHELNANSDYTITPYKDDDYLNGVSTFDLILITKHILGSRKLESPYRLIAADVDRSNSISALDLIQLRKLILSISKTLPNNTSWRFIPANYSFPDPSNPWFASFPEVLNYNDLQSAISDGDFIGLKIGDVNGNATANSSMNSERNLAGVFHLQLEDREITVGKEYRLRFTADELKDIQGCQFTLNHAGLELLEIEYGALRAENIGLPEDNAITISWNHRADLPAQAYSSTLFTLVFQAQQTARLSKLIHLNSRYTQAEAYNMADEVLEVTLRFEDRRNLEDLDRRNLEDSFYLQQNVPNPFSNQTAIQFYLPQAMPATIRIQDLNGKILRLIRGEYQEGRNQIRIDRRDLPANGVLYYTLETETFTATRKMAVIGG